MSQFMVEITDLFAGEPNYSYVVRHKVKAKSPMGAIRKVNRMGGIQFKREFDFGDYEDVSYPIVEVATEEEIKHQF